MSGRFALAVSISTMVLVMTPATGASLQNRTSSSAGVACAYVSGASFSTVVLNVESDGPEAPPITRGMSCAATTTVLIDQGFGFVDARPTVEGDFSGDGIVDAADYVIWRKSSGAPHGRRGTTVITACAHFGGPEVSSELIGLEHDGPQQPPHVTGKSCSAAFSALMDHGFVLIRTGPAIVLDLNGDGTADSQGYNTWRANFGRTSGL